MEKLENWHQRLEFALRERKKKPVDLAIATKNKPPSVHGWLSGGTKMMGADNSILTCEYLKINAKWLFFGVGPSGLDNQEIDAAKDEIYLSIAGKKIKNIEAILLDNYNGMSQAHKEALEQMANALYLIDNPRDKIAAGRDTKKKEKSGQ